LFVFELPEFLQQVSTGSQNKQGFVIFLKFSYLFYSQIWLNLWLDDCWFGYITKLKTLPRPQQLIHTSQWTCLSFSPSLQFCHKLT
jgi:hypothetical protein